MISPAGQMASQSRERTPPFELFSLDLLRRRIWQQMQFTKTTVVLGTNHNSRIASRAATVCSESYEMVSQLSFRYPQR